MTIFGTIYDNATQQGIPGASISVVDPQGNTLGTGIAADNTGWFQLISPLLDQGNKIWVSSIGYASAIIDPNVFVSTMGVGLDPSAANLTAITVIPSGSSSKYTPYLLGGGILALLLLMGGKKKKMGSIGGLNPSSETLLIGGGVVLVGGYFLIKKILPSLNPFPTATNPVDTAATAAAQAKALADAKAAGQMATYSADQYIGWANDIYKLGTSGTPVDQTSQNAIVEDVTNCNNMVDLQSLIGAFGTKPAGGFWCNYFNTYCDTYDLNSFLKAVLDTAHKNNINLYLQEAGINYTF